MVYVCTICIKYIVLWLHKIRVSCSLLEGRVALLPKTRCSDCSCFSSKPMPRCLYYSCFSSKPLSRHREVLVDISRATQVQAVGLHCHLSHILDYHTTYHSTLTTPFRQNMNHLFVRILFLHPVNIKHILFIPTIILFPGLSIGIFLLFLKSCFFAFCINVFRVLFLVPTDYTCQSTGLLKTINDDNKTFFATMFSGSCVSLLPTPRAKALAS